MNNKTSKSNNSMANNDRREQSGERISALVDGEFEGMLDIEGSLDQLIKDKEVSHRWERYHLIADTLKRNLPHVINNQFASRVMAELENEPTVLAPPARVTSSFGKRVVGVAVAASVATVAVLGVQFMYKEDVMAPSPQLAQVQGSAIPSVKSPVNNGFIHKDIQTVTQTISPSGSSAQLLMQQHPSQVIKKNHPNLNKYLLNHNQRASRGVVQGVIPYARIITDSDVERFAHQNKIQSQSQDQRK